MGRFRTALGILVVLFLVSLGISKILAFDIGNKIAVIKISGAIVSDETKIPFQSTLATSSKIIEFIEDADKSDSVKGIVLEINSPGGTVVASKDVADKVKSVNKPVVALIRDVGASGAYWVATAADKIVADPMSITGSIGVISSYLEFSDLMDNYGVTYEGLKSGKYKDIGSPFKKLTGDERGILQKKLDLIHDYFISEVAANRKLSEDKTRQLATGVYFLGVEAKDLGLVDELGGKDLAINITKQLAGITDASIVTYEETESLLDVFSRIESSGAYYFGRGFAAQLQDSRVEKRLEFEV